MAADRLVHWTYLDAFHTKRMIAYLWGKGTPIIGESQNFSGWPRLEPKLYILGWVSTDCSEKETPIANGLRE